MNEQIKDGGPAFPCFSVTQGMVYPTNVSGMSLRDWFAGKAMASLITNAEFGATIQRIFDPTRAIASMGNENESPQEYLARVAYSQADAMLKVREK